MDDVAAGFDGGRRPRPVTVRLPRDRPTRARPTGPRHLGADLSTLDLHVGLTGCATTSPAPWSTCSSGAGGGGGAAPA